MYPNLYCSRIKTFFCVTGKSDYAFPFLFANPCLYPLSARPLSSDQIKEIDQTIPVPAQIMIFTNLDLVLSRKSRVAEMRTMKSKIPNKKTETGEEETTRVQTSRVSSFVILCSFFTQ
ncbi:hypothetical protein VPH35_013073 [Triticum aestivum]